MGFDKRKLSSSAKKFEELEKARAAGERPSKRLRLGPSSHIAEDRHAGSARGAQAPPVAQQALVALAPSPALQSGANTPPPLAPTQTGQPLADREKEPFIVEDEQAAWLRTKEYLHLDDLVPFAEWTSNQLTRSLNHDAIKLHCKALCLSSRLKAKASESANKGQVIQTLKDSNAELEKKLGDAAEALGTLEAEKAAVAAEVSDLKKKNEDMAAEAQTFEAMKASLALKVAELEAELKVAKERSVDEFKSSSAFQDEVGEAYMEGFVDAKVAAMKLFPDLDFAALKPMEDAASPTLDPEEQTAAGEAEGGARS